MFFRVCKYIIFGLFLVWVIDNDDPLLFLVL